MVLFDSGGWFGILHIVTIFSRAQKWSNSYDTKNTHLEHSGKFEINDCSRTFVNGEKLQAHRLFQQSVKRKPVLLVFHNKQNKNVFCESSFYKSSFYKSTFH